MTRDVMMTIEEKKEGKNPAPEQRRQQQAPEQRQRKMEKSKRREINILFVCLFVSPDFANHIGTQNT